MSPTLQTGRYEIIETLGCGGTSRVDKARDTIIGRTVALKSFLQGFGKNSEQQFLREAQTIGRLSHNSIAQLYDVCTDNGGAPRRHRPAGLAIERRPSVDTGPMFN